MKTVVVDPERCIGCLQCEFACAVEHSTMRDALLALVEQPPPRRRVHVQAGPRVGTSFPNKCRHCDPAPCQLVCPTGAIYRDRDHDAVLIDLSRCIACAMCAMVCPFDVIGYHAMGDRSAGRTVAIKCDACIDRLRAGQVPACAEVCKTGALTFADPNDVAIAGRRRVTAAVLAATTSEPPTPVAAETVGAWRAVGEATAAAGLPGGAR